LKSSVAHTPYSVGLPPPVEVLKEATMPPCAVISLITALPRPPVPKPNSASASSELPPVPCQ
jgi:hypothetical protein